MADPAPGSGAPAAAYPSADYAAAEYLATQRHRLRLAAGVREAQQVRDAAAERRDEARRAWATAARRVDALESLDARHRGEHDALVRADEDRVADDLVTAQSTGRRRTR